MCAAGEVEVNGKRGRFAVVDEDGSVIAADGKFAREAEVMAVNSGLSTGGRRFPARVQQAHH
jgi:hypothetical protein